LNEIWVYQLYHSRAPEQSCLLDTPTLAGPGLADNFVALASRFNGNRPYRLVLFLTPKEGL
jgi:hypothetical protein